MGEFQSHERRNWLLHWCFVRGDLENCEKLCKEALSQSAGLSLYPLTINALLLRQQGKLQVTLPYRDINKTECFFYSTNPCFPADWPVDKCIRGSHAFNYGCLHKKPC